MKKKLILFITLVLTIIPSVKADGYDADMKSSRKGNGTVNGISEACNLPYIYNTFYDGSGTNRLNGVRVTIVDENGSRVAGTVSADFSSIGALFQNGFIKTQGSFKYGPMSLGTLDFKKNATIHRSWDGKLLSRIDYKYRDIEKSWSETSTVGVWYWNGLPNFAGGGDSTLLNFFKNNFSTYADDVFTILNYTDYTDPTKYSKHYLLVEPLSVFFVRYPKSTCNSWSDGFITNAYYGTGTELIAMVGRNEREFADSNDGKAMKIQFARDLYTTSYSDGKAGLKAGSTVYNQALEYGSNTNYGLASGLVWISDIMTGGKYCTDKNGIQKEIPNGKTALEVCPRTCKDKNGIEHEYRSEAERQKVCPGTTITKRYCPGTDIEIDIPTIYVENKCSFTSQDFTNVGVNAWTVPTGCSGTYKLEVWGAQGGNASGQHKAGSGGFGGYSTGNVTLEAGTTLYVVVGGQGTSAYDLSTGGYNGGGSGYGDDSGNDQWKAGSGGGATHIGTFNSTLAAHGNTSGLFIVAGGGGGGGALYYDLGNTNQNGGSGGGVSGLNGLGGYGPIATGGTQSSGGTGNNSGRFGQGGSVTSQAGGGGGGGYYGGGSGRNYNGGLSGAGGSGYVGGVLNGSMTTGVQAGNGKAKITLVSSNGSNGTMIQQNIDELIDELCGCKYSVSTNVSGDCTTGTSGTVKDIYTRNGISDEKCLYDAIDKTINTFAGEIYAPNGDTTFSGLSSSNPYCTVACKESVTYYFPSTFTVQAGANFSIGNIFVVDTTYAKALGATDYYYIYSGYSSNPSIGNQPELRGQERVHSLNGRRVEDVCADHESRGEVLNGQCGIKINTATSSTILNPVRIVGTSTCTTGYMPTGNGTHSNTIGINIEQFKKDYAAANKSVAEAWDNVLRTQTKIKALENATKIGTTTGKHGISSTTNLTYCYQFSGCSNGSCEQNLVGKKDRRCHDLNGRDVNTVCAEHRSRGEVDGYCRVEASTNIYEHDGNEFYIADKYSGKASVITTLVGKFEFTASYEEHQDGYTKNKEKLREEYETELSNAKNVYNAAVSARDNVVNTLRGCTNFYRTYKEFEPGLDFVYSDNYYKANHSLLGTAQLTASITTNNGGSKNFSTNINSNKNFEMQNDNVGNTSTIAKWNCGTDMIGCTHGIETYPISTTATSISQKVYNYNLSTNTYRYVAKNGKSYNTSEEAMNSNFSYVDIGFGNLPIHYATPNGTYDYYLEYYYSSGTPNLFGVSQKYKKYNKIESGSQETYNGLVMSSKLKYHCTYNVTTEFQEDCHGGNCDINVIYRPIDLNNPFPGVNGTGRNPGSNWVGLINVQGSAYYDYVYAGIKNNRGVETNEVYNLKPMYEH